VFQGGHLVEHLIQMWQMHVLNLKEPDARGFISILDVEWVHFVFNTWVLLVSGLLLYRFPANRWLWAMVIFSTWHEFEHAYLMGVFLTTGKAGTPGLLAQGGAILGGTPLPRADLHFLYNLVEVVLLVGAFRSQYPRRRPRGQSVAASDGWETHLASLEQRQLELKASLEDSNQAVRRAVARLDALTRDLAERDRTATR
jgi:hypothetical protein